MLDFIAIVGGILGCVFVVIVEKEFDLKRKGVYYNKRKYEVLKTVFGILSVGILFTGVFFV